MTSQPFTVGYYSRPDLLARLLQHGPLTRCEAIGITGWTEEQLDSAMGHLRTYREVRRVNVQREPRWHLTNCARVCAFAEPIAEIHLREIPRVAKTVHSGEWS